VGTFLGLMKKSKKLTNLIAINRDRGHISGKLLTPAEYAEEMFIDIPHDPFAVIDLVIVPPVLRRRGNGTKLVRSFMVQAKKLGARSALAEIVNDDGSGMVDARRAFFESLGFKVFPVNEAEHDNPPLLMLAEL
jgi:predicted GNAT superfamily acetyltransferase